MSDYNLPVVINAGGKGTRLHLENKGLPKALTKVFSKPIIQDQIDKFCDQGVRSIFVILGFKGEVIKRFLEKKYYKTEVKIRFLEEKNLLGSGGSLVYFIDELPSEFLFIYCDIFFDVELRNFISFHKSKKAHITTFVHPNDHPYDSDLIYRSKDDRVTKIFPHPHKQDTFPGNLVNAAFYVVKKSVIKKTIFKKTFLDFAQDMLPEFVKQKKVFCYETPEFVKDMGTPERLKKVRLRYQGRFNLNKSFPVIYLDRDGTINEILKGEYITKPEQMVLKEGAAKALNLIREKGYFIILITNQPVLARGEVTSKQLKRIHNMLDWQLGLHKAYIDKKYICPHHPDKGFENEVKSLKKVCDCRKPETGLLKKSMEYIKPEKSQSWFVGDSKVDIQCGKNFGLNTCLIADKSNYDADVCFSSLIEFSEFLVDLN